MEKNCNFFIVIIAFLCFFAFNDYVFAKNVSICKYDKGKSGANAVNRSDSDNKWYVKLDGFTTKGPYSAAFNKNIVTSTSDKPLSISAVESIPKEIAFMCPKFVCQYNITYYFTYDNECPEKINNNKLKKQYKKNDDIESNIKNNYFNENALRDIVKEMNNSEVLKNGNIDSITTEIATRIITKVSNKYFNKKEVPTFLKTYIEGKVSENKDLIKSFLDTEMEQAHDSGQVTDEAYNQYTETSDQLGNIYSAQNELYNNLENTTYGSTVKEPVSETDCNSILGADMTELVKNILNFLRFLGPALVIIFTIIEFVGAVFSADASLTKPLGRLIRRLIAAALLFFLPSLIIPLFNYLHITMSDTCMNFLR